MGSKAMAGASIAVAFAFLCFMRGATGAAAPPTDCSVSFNSLQPCIVYVNGNSSAPPSSTCCNAFGSVQSAQPVCLCQLLQAFADPKTAPGNATRAMAIPKLCNVPVDTKKCSSLTGTPTPAPTTPAAPVATPPPVRAPAASPPAGAPAPTRPISAPAPSGANVDCTNAFNDLSTCLTFVTGNGQGGPPKDCCTALGKTQKSQPVCLCQLLAQVSNSSSLGVNVTLAMSLPQLCKVAADTSKCPALLGAPVSAPVATPPKTPPKTAPTSAPIASPAAPTSAPDCSAEFSNLSPCLTYVSSNDSNTPPNNCCTALSSVHLSKPVCLCELLQMFGSNSSVSGVNVTKSLALPAACKVPVDTSKCPALLGQPVSSPSASPSAGPLAPPVGSPSTGTPGASSPSSSPSKPGGSGASTLRAKPLLILLTTLGGFGGFLCFL